MHSSLKTEQKGAIRQLQSKHDEKSFFTHDETKSESEIRSTVPNFFNVKFGKRETYCFYRGFVITRSTRQFTGCAPERLTFLYVYLPNSGGTPDLLHVNTDATSVRAAKQHVDRILESGILK